jgi:hypothetical protein
MAARKPTGARAPHAAPAPHDAALRQHVVELLTGGHAHVTFDAAIEGLPADVRNAKPGGLPHSPWRLLEHLRIAQWDILEFSRNERHVSPAWPEGYWPTDEATDASWDRSVGQFREDLDAMRALVTDPASDLFARIPWGDGQTLLREALLVADHNAYHLGEIVVVRRLLGAWKG